MLENQCRVSLLFPRSYILLWLTYCTFSFLDCSQRILSINLWLLSCRTDTFYFLFLTFLVKRRFLDPLHLSISVTGNWFYNPGARGRYSWLFGELRIDAKSLLAFCNSIINHMLKTLLKTWFNFPLIPPNLFITTSTNLSKQVNSNISKLIAVQDKLIVLVVALILTALLILCLPWVRCCAKPFTFIILLDLCWKSFMLVLLYIGF